MLTFSDVGTGAQALDWDGFVAKLDPTKGQILFNNPKVNTTTESYFTSVASQPGYSDYINCIAEDNGFLFIVGSTEGKIAGTIEGGAYIEKLDLVTLQPVWKQQIGGAGIQGSVCAVFNDVVYVGGQVPNGKEIGTTKPSGRQDAFLAQFSTANGTMNWLSQFGSTRDDALVDMLVDRDGTPVVFGNDYDQQTRVNDVFLLSFLPSNGYNKPQWTDPLLNQTNTNEAASQSTSSTSSSNDKRRKMIISVSIVIPFVFAMIVVLVECRRHRTKKEPIDISSVSHDLTMEQAQLETQTQTVQNTEAKVV